MAGMDLADPRSPRLARTPVRQPYSSSEQPWWDLNDPRSPRIGRSPVVPGRPGAMGLSNMINLLDPRSPRLDRTPIKAIGCVPLRASPPPAAATVGGTLALLADLEQQRQQQPRMAAMSPTPIGLAAMEFVDWNAISAQPAVAPEAAADLSATPLRGSSASLAASLSPLVPSSPLLRDGDRRRRPAPAGRRMQVFTDEDGDAVPAAGITAAVTVAPSDPVPVAASPRSLSLASTPAANLRMMAAKRLATSTASAAILTGAKENTVVLDAGKERLLAYGSPKTGLLFETVGPASPIKRVGAASSPAGSPRTPLGAVNFNGQARQVSSPYAKANAETASPGLRPLSLVR